VSSVISTFFINSGEDKKSHRAMSGSTGVDAPVECGEWQKTARQVQPSVLVRCHDEFACTRLPFSWLCMANCIIAMSQHF
jgi:hypothetical protein